MVIKFSLKNSKFFKNITFSWFQNFAYFLMLNSFFWVIPRRLNFMCRRFGTLCLFHLHKWCKMEHRSVSKIQTPVNCPKGRIQQTLLKFVNNSWRNIPFVVWNCICDYKRRLHRNILGEWVSYLVIPHMNDSVISM